MPAIATWTKRVVARLRSLLAAARDRPRLVAGLVLGFACAASLSAGLTVGVWRTVCHDCPSIAQIYVWEPKQATKILSHDGQLVAELFQERRTPVSLSALPDYVPRAFVAVEDKRFYRHHGFDFFGIARAAVNFMAQRRISGGGSTITQQLARNMFPEEVGFERRGWRGARRKLKELRVALELEKVYGKDQILEAYINQINYDHGRWGIESAAQYYFGKSSAEVNPAEAAMLAAVINRPGGYFSPFRNPDRAKARRNRVLRLMAEQRYLSRADAERWRQEPLPDAPHGSDEGELAPYFVEWVRDQLYDRFGIGLYQMGLRVYTSLDVEVQRAAVSAIQAGWERIEGQPGFRHPSYSAVMEAGGNERSNETDYLQGMLIALEPRTGEIRALIGGRDFSDSKFNRAVQARRQPGSVFKPFVYTAAIASGIPASHVIFDAPIMMEQVDGTTWSPGNYDGTFSGPMTLRDALKRSINIPAVKLGLEVGIETVAQYARRLGIETPIPRYPSTAIGAGDVIPLQVAGAYTAFATQGVRTRPRPILRIEDAEGRLLWETRPDTARVLDPLVASIMLDMLRHVVDHGTAQGSVRARGGIPYTLPAAGKTGTTNDATDVWFVGFTPDLLAAVWFGFDRPKKLLAGADGGRYAAPVWADFIRSVYLTDPPLRPVPEPWLMPEALTTRRVDKESGKLASEWCPADLSYVEIFVPGTEPTEVCDLHGPGIFGGRLRGLLPDSVQDSTGIRIVPRIRF